MRACRWFPLVLGAAVLVGCGPRPAPPTARPVRPPTSAEPPQEGPAALTARELALVPELTRDVEHLAGSIGERNVDKKWELASAADWLAGELEGMGSRLRREGYELEGVAAQNLEIELRGEGAADEIVIVGAHYDSAAGSPGADDNASGVAAVLALARRFRSAHPVRTLRFVLFTNEEPPYFQTPNMGSAFYAQAARARGERVTAMLSLESLGFFSDAPASQRYPEPLAARHPSVGNFVAVVGNRQSSELVARVGDTLRARGSVPVEAAALDAELPGVGWSDHWSFWQIGAPAVMITDTAPFRNPHYHRASDRPQTLDTRRLARVVAAVEAVVAELVGDALGLVPR